jgi:hypothetical protein
VLYYGCKLAALLQTTLEELGHVQQTPTPITTNNITAQGLTVGTMTPKASKSMDQHLSLAQILTSAMPISISLAKGYPQLRQLLKQTSCTKT